MLAALALLAGAAGPVAAAAEAAGATPTFHRPSLVGTSNYTHFWMPEPLFRAAAEPSAPLLVGIALHGDSGPWGKCPNPKHPQNCSAMYQSRGASGASWSPTTALHANALIQPTADGGSRGFSGKIAMDASTNTTGSFSWQEWRWTAHAGVRVVHSAVTPVVGLPPIDGASLTVLPSSARLGDGSWLALAYGATQADRAAGSGNRTCVPLFHWQAHYCAAVFVLATADEGRSWRYRSSLHWHPTMGSAVGGPTEAALTLLRDGRLLAVYRVEEHENLWQSLSSDGGQNTGKAASLVFSVGKCRTFAETIPRLLQENSRLNLSPPFSGVTWREPRQTVNTWSVFPQVRQNALLPPRFPFDLPSTTPGPP
jgi:hypothetical protein